MELSYVMFRADVGLGNECVKRATHSWRYALPWAAATGDPGPLL